MTAIGNQFSNAIANALVQNVQHIAGGFIKQMAEGIMGQFLNALGAGPNAFGSLPKAFDIRCGTMLAGNNGNQGITFGGCYQPPKCGTMLQGNNGNQGITFGGCYQPYPWGNGCFPGPICLPKPQAQWTANIDGQNTAKINLGDGYRLEIDERSSQIMILNEKTGEKTRIWGDPHVEIDGKHAYDFWGTTTFTLENGTKITINTEQWGGNPNAYVASQLVITKGDNAIVVDGVSQNKLGDLSISMSQNGEYLDAVTRDGYTLHENACGSGWLTEEGNVATQADLNATAVGGEYGPGSQAHSMGEIGEFLGSFLLFGGFASFLNNPAFSKLEQQIERAVEKEVRQLFHPALALR